MLKNFWIYYNMNKASSSLFINETGWHNSDPGYDFKETRTNSIIHFVVDGKCRLYIGDEKEEIEVKAGQAFIIPEGNYHRYIADEKEGCFRYWIAFSGPDSHDILKRFGVNKDNYVIGNFQREKIERVFRKIYKTISSKEKFELRLYSLAYSIFDMVQSEILQSDETEKSGSAILADSIANFISENVINDITVKDIEAKFGYEHSYIYRVFKKEKGLSIQNFMIKCRMQEARSLLMSTEKAISEIALMLGYDSYSAFVRLFTKYAGSTPSKFRESYRLSFPPNNKK